LRTCLKNGHEYDQDTHPKLHGCLILKMENKNSMKLF